MIEYIQSVVGGYIGLFIAHYVFDVSIPEWSIGFLLIFAIPVAVVRCHFKALSKLNVKQGTTLNTIEENERKCPFCAETIKAEAILCRYCGKDLPFYERPSVAVLIDSNKYPTSTAKDKIITLLQSVYIFIYNLLPFKHLLISKDDGWRQVFVRIVVGFTIGKVTSSHVYYWLISIFFNGDRNPGEISTIVLLLTDIIPILIVTFAVLYALKRGEILVVFHRLLIICLGIITLPIIMRVISDGWFDPNAPLILGAGLIAIFIFKKKIGYKLGKPERVCP